MLDSERIGFVLALPSDLFRRRRRRASNGFHALLTPKAKRLTFEPSILSLFLLLLFRSGINPLSRLPGSSTATHRDGGEGVSGDAMARLYVQTVPPPDLNKNTEWFMYPGVWTTYILILFFSWLLVLSFFGCSAGMAWTVVNLFHFAVGDVAFPSSPQNFALLPPFFLMISLAPNANQSRVLIVEFRDAGSAQNSDLTELVTYYFFHWKKGTPFAEDQGIYNNLTWWEQIDNGKQLTRNRKFLAVVPVVLQNFEPVFTFDILVQETLWHYLTNTHQYLIASHTTDYQHPMLFLNTLAVSVLVIAKFPNMHKVRIFGING
ncbi:hypothetical protein ZIOFF_059371 [Zingiber officinale]|uniref:Uncharacterized protein n=1 Tax=Zingiber officinale TaxID=94328 RepID=A0A8J5KMK9_ZINOF|nr:hypothetical protein ZIOFF_059371 [Zingiber officinale]